MNREILELNYTEKYEYAKKTIQNYLELEREIDLNTETPVDIYSGDTFLFGIMETDFRNLTDEAQRNKLAQILDRQTKKDAEENGERSYSTIEARLYHLVIDLAQTLGADFLVEVRKNLVASILRCTEKEAHRFWAPAELTDQWDTIENFLTKFPILLIASIGYTEFIRAVMKARKDKMRKASSQRPVAPSKPIVA